jgi:hypothetical protein
MSVLKLSHESRVTVFLCLLAQICALIYLIKLNTYSISLVVIAFFLSGFITDLVTGLAHFSFDYIWPDNFPIFGPISVEFRAHHERPTLDPSAVLTNLTMGAYVALPFAIITIGSAVVLPKTAVSFLIVATLMGISLWMLGFHQIHSYAHMGSNLSPDEFNQAVVKISQLPDEKQHPEFAKLFQTVGIPPLVRFLQRSRLFLRPEIHWKHHIKFESDFSSLNGWSDPLMNWIYQPISQKKKIG